MLNDADFIAALQHSQHTVNKVAAWLERGGYKVRVPETRIRPEREQWQQYSDDGDLFIEERVEVKQRPDIDFTGPADFPYQTVIVDRAHRIEGTKPLPLAWVIVNASGTVAIIVQRNTRNDWRKAQLYNRKDKEWRDYYECPLRVCTFVKFGGGQ